MRREARLRGWRRVRHGLAVSVALLLLPVPTVAVALFTPGSATAGRPLTGPEARWLHARVHGRRPPDPRRASPAEVARFFAALPAADAGALAARYPSVVGNLDGAPVRLRYSANARVLAGRHDDFARWARGRHRFLAYDPRAGGRVVQVFGDLSRSERVAVIVPGVGQALDDFARPSRKHPYRSPRRQARSLYREAHRLAPHERVAVVAWLGYHPPDELGRGAAREEVARTGAADLDRFLDGLALTAPRARISVLGHSYGSVVTGLAAPHLPQRVTDLVVTGSPGMGVDSADDLHTTARVWAGRAADDWISDVPDVRVLGVGHGTDPMDAGFGARRFGTDGAYGHDEYFMPGTESLRNMTAIVLGRDAAVR